MSRKIVADSSSIISLSDSCLLYLMREINRREGIEFVIPKSVEFESVTRPLEIHRFELNAMRIKKGIDEGWISVSELNEKSVNFVKEMKIKTNSLFFSGNRALEIMHAGELEALALAKEINAVALLVDERTTRMLLEEPFRLKELIQRRQGVKVEAGKDAIAGLESFMPRLPVIRSTELIAFAFEKNLFNTELLADFPSLQAALYAVKFKGCAVSGEEIEKYLKSLGG